jgi:peptide-methionine (R)-S-oxide reductase
MSDETITIRPALPKEEMEARLAKLTPLQYNVTQEAGTERAFTGTYWNHHADGTYRCVVCSTPLFDSNTKFESGSGWPSFYDVLANDNVVTHEDGSFFMRRVEVNCATCGAHLGHVFPDGPRPTGLRYCINSASLEFAERPASG